MIYLEPQGGLANRLRVIANGIWLKRMLNTQLCIIWNETHELNCPYHLLLEPIADFTIIPKKRVFDFVTRTVQPDKKSTVKAKLKNFIARVDICITDADYQLADVYETVRHHKRIYIKTCQRFTDSIDEFKLFKPIAMLSFKINELLSTLNPTGVGVQVRRTDNAMAIANSPLELFTARMHELLAADDTTRFFLATDDVNVELELKLTFGDRIISPPKDLSRQTVAGIQAAVVDLFVLAGTGRILGSYWSSFSEVAAWMGDIPLEVIKKDSVNV
ncbi:hypothetical protein SAMN05192574_108277 [Mucilaginibacter gossypiicola]|uniref:Uncharacterized protein n=1 Tax=Mucilaginibacter gossypiicola TaxID=551995 RepID=A0A1H8Q5G2_9SPHI|nr:hypothetical protein [Mucilaginibacter gossypiicola]SEO49157.1 hypothetical protein SAMN05192574_108277 [Mucilaginibacter gossypiicola]